MDKSLRGLLCLVLLLGVLGPGLPRPMAAAPVESEVYEVNFTTHISKDYTEGAVWDIWSGFLRLERPDGAGQNSSVVALDGNGNAVVVWADSRNGHYDIYAQRLDSNGNRLWAQDTRVNSDSGTIDQGYPASKMEGLGKAVAVAVDESGNAVVVWWDDRSGNYDIYAQRLDVTGNRLWVQDVRVNYDSEATQWYPAVSIDGSGNAVVVWGDNRNGNYDIYAQRLDANGSRLWAQDMRINSDGGIEGQWNPAVVIDGSDNAIVVWTDRRNDNSDIYAQRLNSGGSRLWAQDARVNSDSGTTDQGYSAVAVDGSGKAVVTWWDNRDGNRNIYAQRLDVAGIDMDTGHTCEFRRRCNRPGVSSGGSRRKRQRYGGVDRLSKCLRSTVGCDG